MIIKTPLKILFIIFTISIFIWSCSSNDDAKQMAENSISSDEDNANDENQIEPININVQVVLPEGSDLDLATTKIISFSESFDVDDNGKATIKINPFSQVFVSLQDENDNVILYGFVGETDNELSIASSAKASLYFALGTFMQFEGIKDRYINEFVISPEIIELQNGMENLFLENRNFMEQESFSDLVKNSVDRLINNKEIFELSKGVIVDSQEKSGIRIINSGRDAIGFQSRSRRRSHAFIYKISHKTKDGVLVQDIIDVTNANPTEEIKIDNTNGFTSTLGTIWEWGSGKGLELFLKETPPIGLPLKQKEQEANYDVRVVGASTNPFLFQNINLNRLELEKIEDLNFDTAAFDIILPVMGTLIGFKEFDSKNADAFKTALTAAMGSSFFEEITNGKIKEGSLSFIKELSLGLVAGSIDENLERLINTIANLIDFDPGDWESLNNEKIEKVFRPLQIIDAILQGNDAIGRILPDITSSNPLEEWEVTISDSNDLNCSVEKPVLNAGQFTLVEAVVQNLELLPGQEIHYEWATTGGNGELINDDEISNNELITTGIDNLIAFRAFNTIDFVFGEVQQEINVRAYIRENGVETEVGTCNLTVRITENNWKIRPDNITLSGNQGVQLSIVDELNNPISPPEGTKLYIEWNSTGKHGQINNNQLEGSPFAIYQCLDYDTTEGLEDITAKVYFIGRNTRILEANLEATIQIKNEDNIIYTYLPNDIFTFNVTPPEGNAFVGNIIFSLAPVEDAINYTFEILEYNKPVNGRIPIGNTFSTNEIYDRTGEITWRVAVGSVSPDNEEAIANLTQALGEVEGLAKVTIQLDPNRNQ